MRLFIAIKISPNNNILEILSLLKKFGKTVEAENIHLTLKFMGEVSDHQQIINSLETIRFKIFDLELKGMGAFPNERRGRILFLKAYPENILVSLANEIDRVTQYIPMDHPFSPHITVVRIKNYADLTQIIGENKNKNFLIQKVDHFSLFKSTLTPRGPIYEELNKFQLM